MSIEPIVDSQIANGFDLKNYPDIFIPKNDFTLFGHWFHTCDLGAEHIDWGNSVWKFRLYFSSVN